MAGDNLALAIGQQVAGALAPFIAQMLQQVAGQVQKTGCLYCCARRKIAQTAYAEALAGARTEYEIACKAAAELGHAAPEWAEPEPPVLPEVQEAFTWVPVQPVAGQAPVAIPVCYDCLPDRPAEDAPAPPPDRPTGLVTADGRQIIARG